jgi:hypothetical protein
MAPQKRTAIVALILAVALAVSLVVLIPAVSALLTSAVTINSTGQVLNVTSSGSRRFYASFCLEFPAWLGCQSYSI